MNHIYRLVWNRAKRVMQVVSEVATGGRGGGTAGAGASRLRAHPLALACASALALWLGGAGSPLHAATCTPGSTAACSAAGGDGAMNRGGAGGAGNGGGGGASVFDAATSSTVPVDGAPAAASGAGGDGASGDSAGGAGAGPFATSSISVTVGSGATATGNAGGAGPDGFNFANGGGGGGATVVLTSSSFVTVDAGAVVTGGAGGAGGDGTSGAVANAGGGGGGGAAVMTTAANADVNNNGTITGGAGGNGGAGGFGGGGGGGGDALLIFGAATAVTNSGTLTGGSGGAAGTGSTASGQAGAGGVGVNFAASGATLVNTGTISGGLGGDGVTRAAAIRFGGTGNTLVQTGSGIVGDIVLDAGAGATIRAAGASATLNDGIVLGSGSALALDTSAASMGVVGDVAGDGTLATSGSGALTLYGVDVASLHSTTSSLILHDDVTTSGSQVYDGDALVWSDVAFTSTGDGDISFNGDVVGADYAMTVNTGGTTRLGTVTSGWGPVYSLTTDAGGTTELNGNVNSNHQQAYNDQVRLGADVVLTSELDDSIGLAAGVDGAHALTIDTGGTTTLGMVGAMTALTSLTTDAGGGTLLQGDVTTTGAQAYGDAVTLGADATLASTGGGTIQFDSTVDGARALDVRTSGVVMFGDAVSLSALSVDAGTLTTNALTILGDLSLAASSGIAQLSGAYAVGGSASFDAGTADILLASIANDFGGAVSLAGHDANIAGMGALQFGNVATSGDLAATAASGGITQTGTGTLTVGGTTTLTASAGDILLDRSTNDFAGAVSLSGVNADIADANALQLGTVSLAGNLAATAGGAITQSGALVVGGDAGFDAGTSAITLANAANRISGTVNLSGGDASIANVGALQLGALSVGDLAAHATGGGVGLGHGTVAGDLAVMTDTGSITQSDPLAVGGTTSLQALSGDITLANVGNDFTGVLDAIGRNITVYDVGDLTVADIFGVGRVDLSAAGTLAVDQRSMAFSVNGAGVTLTGGTGIALGGAVMSSQEQVYDGAVTLTRDSLLQGMGNTSRIVDRIEMRDGLDGAHALTIGTNGDVVLGNVGTTTALTGLSASGYSFAANEMHVDGALWITTTGADSGIGVGTGPDYGWTVTGATHLDAGGGIINLLTGSNDFQGTVDAAGGSVMIVDANDLDIASLANGANGDVILSAGGTLTLPTGAIDTGAGNLTLSSGGALATPGALSGHDVSVSSAGGALAIGDDVTASGNATLHAGTAMALDADVTAASIQLSGGAGASITQAGGALVASALGSSNVAPLGDVSLTSAGNDIGMLGGINAASFSLTNLGFMRIDGHSTVANDFSLRGPSFTLVGSIDAGNTVLRSGTALAVGDGGTAGTLAGDVTVESGSALFFRRSDDVAYAGAIGGTGTVDLQTPGIVTLDGDSSAFAGNTIVDSGTLVVGGTAGNGAALGGDVAVSGFGALGGHGTIGGDVELFNAARLAPGNSIGTLAIGGDLTLHDGNALDFEFGAPGTPLSTPGIGDRVDVGGNLAIGAATLDVTDAGGMGPGLYTVLTWGGALTQANGGLALGTVPAGRDLQLQVLGDRINLLDIAGLTFNFWNGNGAATASQLGGGSGTWSATSANWTDASALATVAMQPQPGFAIFGGAAGTVGVDDGAGAVTASGLQFASDGYRIEGDALTLAGSGGAAPVVRVGDGSAAGAAMTATIGSVVAGSDGLRKEDAGTLVLSGANTYGGGTAIAGGTLRVASDANLGAAGAGITLDGGTLAASGAFATDRGIVVGAAGGGVRSDAAMTLDGAITGTGTLTHLGSGTLLVGGDGSAFAGTTQVASGTLLVGGSAGSSAVLGGDVAVAAGAVLGGHGRIEGDVANAGVVAPGASIGTLTIGGDYTQSATGVLQIEATEGGGADKLVVDGAAALDGSLLALAQDGDWRGQVDYTILTASGGVSGRFAGASSRLAFLDPMLAYGADAVTLTLRRNDVEFASVARTPNQAGVAAAADALGWGDAVYEELTTLDAAHASAAFDSLSGEIHAVTRGALLGDARQLRDALTQQLAATGPGDHGAAWATGWGHWSRTDADGNAAAVDADGSGLAVGGDLPFGERVRLGAMLGSGRLSVDSDARASRADVDSRHAGAYALVDAGVLRLQGGVVRSTHDVDTTRTAAFGDLREALRGDADAGTTQSYLDASHRFAFGQAVLAPFVNIARIRVHGDAFDESGGAAALHVDAGSSARTVSTLGARWDWTPSSKALRFWGMAAWMHATGDATGTATERFAAGSTPFDVSGPLLARNATALDVGLRWQAGARATVDASWNGRFGDGGRDSGARLTLRVAF